MLIAVVTSDAVWKPVSFVKSLTLLGILGLPVKSAYAPENNVGLLTKSLYEPVEATIDNVGLLLRSVYEPENKLGLLVRSAYEPDVATVANDDVAAFVSRTF